MKTTFQPLLDTIFHEAAETYADRTAIAWRHQQVSYAQLEAAATSIANRLHAMGMPKNAIVAVLMDDPIGLVTSLIGILKAGGAFAVLDPSYPEQRLRFMLEAAPPSGFLIEARFAARLKPLMDSAREQFCLIVDDGDDPASLPEQTLSLKKARSMPIALDAPVAREPDDLCYIYFTSGSTGKPKAIAGRLGSLSHFIAWERQTFQVNETFHVSQIIPPAFDPFLRDVFVPLCSGATLCVPDSRETILDPGQLLRWMHERQITLMHCVPTLFRALVNEPPRPEYVTSLKYLLIAGEPLFGADVKKWMDNYGDGVQLVNLYGPTETTLAKFCYLIQPADKQRHLMPVGKPIDGASALVLDDERRPCAPGVAGEIYIQTPHRTLGYYNRPELTSEVFIPNPFSADPQDILYKTGDVGRVLEDGNFEVLGRKDHQVKIRGVRIELGEIEQVLRDYPAIKDAVVKDWDRAEGEKYLCAYFVADTTLAGSDVRAFLAQTLPPAMLPAVFIQLDKLPLTPNGKIDRKALPEPDESSMLRDDDMIAPRTPIEARLAAIWADVLGLQRVGVTENFFALGGHSLLAVRCIIQVQKSFQIDLPLTSLFEAPTIQELAAQIEQGLLARSDSLSDAEGERSRASSAASAIHPRQQQGPLALSFAQESLWLVDQLAPGNVAYNLPWALRLEGPLNVGALEQALTEVGRRHETLRTTFPVIENRPTQAIAPTLDLSLAVEDVPPFPEAEREQYVRQRLAAEIARPFDLARGPLLRCQLLRLAENQHLLFLLVHHIIADEWSKNILLRELTALYSAFAAGAPATLPDLPIQYADYALWQRERLQGGLAERLVQHWKERLAGAPTVLDLPTDHPRPAVQSFRGAQASFQAPRALTEQLRALGQQEQASLFMTLLAAFQALLARYTGQEDIVVGAPTANRNHAETEPLIGYLVNMLALRTDLSGAPSFRELLRRVRGSALDAYAHQELPFEKLVEALQPERSLSYTPLFQVMFTVENAAPALPETAGVTWQPFEIETATAKVDLALSLRDGPQGLSGFFEYATDLFEAGTIERLVGHWQTLLAGIVAHPDQPITSLPILTEAERQRILVDWNATQAPYPADQCFHQLFEAQAARTPDAVAVVCASEQLTYRQLNERANQLAHYLRRMGVVSESLVGLYVRRSVDMLVGLLGILKAGGAYVPIDPSYPKERIAGMLEDCQARVLVTQASLAHTLPAHQAQIICLDQDWPTIAQERLDNPDSAVQADHLAYIIYTSGSTGKPKGVLVTHRGLPNVAELLRQQFQPGPASRVLQVASISFDASLWDVLMALPFGGTLYIATDEQRIPGPALLRLLQEQGITIATLTPSALAALPDANLPALQVIVSTAEACTAEIVSRWARGRRFFNGYGPTETTIGATLAECDASGYTPSIGRPFINTQVYVLDRHLQPVPVGVVGELCVGGVGLARGYYNRPELTAEKFIVNPFSPDPASRLYRTGDLARWRPDGTLEFAGRLDQQIKLRGFRIELGEIEAALRQHPGVRDVAALVLERPGKEKRLVAYIVPTDREAPTSAALRAFLLQHLPEYMLPSAFVSLEALPLTPNGKVDRRALPLPDERNLLQGADFVAPRTPTEELLATIWAEELGLPQVSVTENFFALGGHSLLAVRVLLRIQERFQRELPLSTLFEAPTIAALALKLVQSEAEQVDDDLLDALLAELEHIPDAEVQNLLTGKQKTSKEEA